MRVLGVDSGSRAEREGLLPGDDLVAIDGRAVRDGIDVAHAVGMADDDELAFEFIRDGGRVTVLLPAEHPDDLGLDLEPDRIRMCGNRCVFCFIDQLPPGLRRSLYVKDGDYRLSFTCGNYVTLTNLDESDYERVLEQRLSPLYVSVHATDDVVRRKMLGSPDAPAVLPALRRLTDGGIVLHTQIVVCPGMNDANVLEGTLRDLASLGDGLASVAVVPVGLTAHRDGLPDVAPVTTRGAADVITAVERWRETLRRDRDEPVVHAADEFYLLAGLDVPPLREYGDFPQLENGVGMLRWFERELVEDAGRLRGTDAGGTRVTVLTGVLAAPFIENAVRAAFADVAGLTVSVAPVANTLFGAPVTVAGLLGGVDLAAAVRSADQAELYVLPGEAFNADALTLDGMTLEDIRGAAGTDRVEASSDLVATIEELLRRRGAGSTDDRTAHREPDTRTEDK